MRDNMSKLMVIIFFVLCANISGQELDLQQVDGIVVTASRIPSAFSDIARQVTVISSADIEKIPATSIADLLSSALSVDVRNRGVFGVQADVSMRGGTFEQSAILIDGIKVSDPQSGHHNLDLPINIHNIERIEILNGSGSKLYGPNAMGGVINIITKKELDNQALAEISFGDFGLIELSASVGLNPWGTFSISKQKSRGDTTDTDFDITKLAYTRNIEIERGSININAGYSDKEFGAYQFYTGYYPEWEATETIYLSSKADFTKGHLIISPKIFWRRHNDDFILIRHNPSVYRNNTTTNQYGVELQVSQKTSWGGIVLGGEFASEEMTSTGLGVHSRNKGGIFFESQVTMIDNLSIIPGLMAYKYTDYDWKLFPGFDIGYRITKNIKIHSSISKAFRVPTYTDLYNGSSANKGNAELQPEESVSFEAGLVGSNDFLIMTGCYFVRDGKNLIDWLKPADSNTTTWQAENVSIIKTSGFEFSSLLKFNNSFVRKFGLNYTYLHSKKDLDNAFAGYESKYALSHLRHQLIGTFLINFSDRLSQSIKTSYSRRLTGDEYSLTDSRLSWQGDSIRLFIEVKNIFDIEYSETGLSPMPGRWFRIGLSLNTPL